MADDYAGFRLPPVPDGWVAAVGDERDLLQRELLAEIDQGHSLFGHDVIPIYRCLGCNDILVAVADRPGGYFARMTLIWNGAAEVPPRPPFEPVANPSEFMRAHGH